MHRAEDPKSWSRERPTTFAVVVERDGNNVLRMFVMSAGARIEAAVAPAAGATSR